MLPAQRLMQLAVEVYIRGGYCVVYGDDVVCSQSFEIDTGAPLACGRTGARCSDGIERLAFSFAGCVCRCTQVFCMFCVMCYV